MRFAVTIGIAILCLGQQVLAEDSINQWNNSDVIACMPPGFRPFDGSSPSKLGLVNSLIFVAFEGNIHCVQKLVNAGANPSDYGVNNFSKGPALHIALTQKHWDVVLFLLEKGADPNEFYSVMNYGFRGGPARALEVAIANQAPEYVIEAIKKHGGRW